MSTPSRELVSGPAAAERGEARGGADADAAPSGFAEDESIMLLSQDVYTAHESPISHCRFSAEGTLVASVDTENVLRIWNPSALSSSSMTATVARQQTSMQVNALEWEAKSDRLLLLGGEDQKVRVFNMESKTFVSDIPLETEYARVTQLACNPVDPVFMASLRPASSSRARDGCLVLLNMRTMKQQYVLRLEPEKVAMTAMRFNHNGQLLVAGDINGVVRIMDVQSFAPIMEWQAHTCEVLLVQFSFDETSVYSLGADGVLAQWSVHRIGTKLSEVQVDGFDAAHARSVAFDAEGAFLLSSTNRNFATLNETLTGLAVRTLSGHQGPITAVDISPSSFTALTGSTDRTLRVCKLLRV